MFIPLHDTNPLRYVQLHYATIGLIALNMGIFIYRAATGAEVADPAMISFALIPQEFSAGGLQLGAAGVPEAATLLSYAFFHADVWHLLGNMVFLWVFGDNVEDAVGHLRFLVFYCLCAIAAGLVHVAVDPGSSLPLVGASGAVAGVVAAYFILHPRVRLWVLFLGKIPLRLSALWALGAWAALQVWNAVSAGPGGVAWWAHVGGLVAGAVLIVAMRRPGVALFDRGLDAA